MSSSVSVRLLIASPRSGALHLTAGEPQGSKRTLWLSRNAWLLLDGVEALGEAARVALLGPRQGLEPLGDLVEALVARRLGEARVHLGVLVGLALDGRLQVVRRGADGDAGDGVADLGQVIEVTERVAGLALGDRAEQGGHIGVALHVGLLCEVEVAPVGLALASERFLQVVMGLGAVQIGHPAASRLL